MTRTSAAIGSLLFLLLAPGIVAGLVPWGITRWTFAPAVPGYGVVRLLGGLLIVAGFIPLLDAFARFALEGMGTPAPVAPTSRLVVRGPYRYVRNPMYVGVIALIAGQALLFASPALLVYGAVIWLAFHLFVVFYEEPTLRQAHGAEYQALCARVPRWLPRLRPVPTDQA